MRMLAMFAIGGVGVLLACCAPYSMVEASYCVVVATPENEQDQFVEAFDAFASHHHLAASRSPAAAVYTSDAGNEIWVTLALGPLGSSVGYYPIRSKHDEQLRSALAEFVATQIATKYQTRNCADVPNFHTPQRNARS